MSEEKADTTDAPVVEIRIDLRVLQGPELATHLLGLLPRATLPAEVDHGQLADWLCTRMKTELRLRGPFPEAHGARFVCSLAYPTTAAPLVVVRVSVETPPPTDSSPYRALSVWFAHNKDRILAETPAKFWVISDSGSAGEPPHVATFDDWSAALPHMRQVSERGTVFKFHERGTLG